IHTGSASTNESDVGSLPYAPSTAEVTGATQNHGARPHDSSSRKRGPQRSRFTGPPNFWRPTVEELVLADRPVWLLLTIAIVAIALLLVLIIRVKLHAFFSLLIIAVLTGLAAGISVEDVIEVVIDGFSSTVGTVALLVGFGAVLGRLIEITGGAQVLADKMLRIFGEKHA